MRYSTPVLLGLEKIFSLKNNSTLTKKLNLQFHYKMHMCLSNLEYFKQANSKTKKKMKQ